MECLLGASHGEGSLTCTLSLHFSHSHNRRGYVQLMPEGGNQGSERLNLFSQVPQLMPGAWLGP